MDQRWKENLQLRNTDLEVAMTDVLGRKHQEEQLVATRRSLPKTRVFQ